VTPLEFEELIRSGEMLDAHSVAAYGLLRLRGSAPFG
jgi:hypothetical protein